LTTRK